MHRRPGSTAPYLRLPQMAGAACLALLAACGGGGGNPAPVDDPLKPYREQKVDWHACDPDFTSVYEPDIRQRLTCATIRVPLDYAAPSLGDLQFAVARVAATEPARRRGAILFNPGGPGSDGLTLGARYASLWGSANPDTDIGSSLLDIVRQHDLIGFSPRGLGGSTLLRCPGSEGETFALERHATDRSTGNIAAMLSNARRSAEVCTALPLARHITTENVVRDLDLVRELLGDQKLSYAGTSYGTWIGAWYAARFPERVDRMILDSTMDVTGNFDVNQVLQPMSMQRVIDTFMGSYAARHPTEYGLGTDPAALGAAYRALDTGVLAVLGQLMQLGGVLHATDAVANGVMLIAAAKGAQQVLDENPDRRAPGDADLLIDKLNAVTFSSDFGYDIEMRGRAGPIVKHYLESPTPQALDIAPPSAVFTAISCNDTPTRTDAQYWSDLGTELAGRYPYAGGTVTRNPCIYWGGHSATKPPLERAALAPPILMLQSESDALTALEGAQRTFDQLPQAHMVRVTNHYTHGLLSSSIPCVMQQIGRYFADGKLAGRSSQCDGPALPLEATDSASLRAAAAPIYTDPERAARIQADIRALLLPAR